MKKILTIVLAVMMLLTLSACGGHPNQSAIVGTWKLVDTETETDYGLGIEFTADGKIRYGLTEDILTGLAEGENVDDAMAALDMLMTIEYKILSDSEMEIIVSAMFGLAKESDTTTYKLTGDTLEFDGATYTRVK